MAITTVSSHVVSVNAIQGTLIADNAITAVHIATNAVSGTLIADNAVTATHIAQNTITVTQIADDAIEAAKIADGVITTNHLNKAMISSQTEVTPVAGDFVLIGDTSDSNNLKKVPISGITALATTSGINSSADADAIFINSSENVGIGSSTINAKFNVHGTIRAENDRFLSGREDAAAPAYAFHDDADTGIFNVNANILGFSTAGSERMRIDSSGHLLIGATATPSSSDVKHVISAATGAFTQFSFNGGAGSVIGSPATSTMAMYTYTGNIGSETYTERMRIHGSGCVGIGSSTDRSLGTNIGTLVINGSAGGGLWLSPGDSSAMTSKIYAEANGSVGDLIINNGTGVGSGGIRFQTNAAQKMILDSGGRLLINKTSSSLTFGKLQVEAGGEASGHGGIVFFGDSDVSVGSGNVIQVLWFYGDNDATGGVFTRYRDGNSIMGQVTCANGTQVSYGVSSDERLKENIVDASSQLDTIKNIKVREFDWKVNGYHEVGMIAQELHTVIPSVVQQGGDDIDEEVWGVDYGKLTPYLVKALQEQQTIIDDLKSRIETLEG